jgi:hypothetical protein|tara:strand:+ start:437 stop:664 length:228 start_codon:yes stop_codon:yes gene_type:complete
MNISNSDKIEFLNLANYMSPENVSCDGELSRTETNRKYSKLQTQWRKLEKKVGCRVEEDEVWDWYKEGDINEMYS